MKSLFSFLLLTAVVMNSSCAEQGNAEERAPVPKNTKGLSQATFAAGCFWCEEAIFESVKGVSQVVSGYAGGTKPAPTYEDLGSGPTCHAEMVNIYYDSSVIDYPTLLKLYFASQNPTQVDGQGPDKGAQYRSLVFYRNQKEKDMAENQINQLNKSGKYDRKITVSLVPFTKFWMAEEYHQHFVDRNPTNPYVLQESIPRIRRFQKQFPQWIKPGKFY